MTPKERAAITALQEALAERKVLTMTQEEIVDAIRSARIEQAEQEQVADKVLRLLEPFIPQDAAPVRTKDLTDDEIEEIGKSYFDEWSFGFARAVIAADREKNK